MLTCISRGRTFDTLNIHEMWLHEGGWLPCFEGVNFVDSGGRGALWAKGPKPIGWMMRDPVWFTECHFDGIFNPCNLKNS
ncbi:hypothetical protein [Aurantiacibacter zhengii]|uniref:Uncharacterized protein n=1 Tax=Aurantiacibacter zhengii TaxID=2307003 RepID=A0A418NN35_9SPHN|nr:hypothetical protein [Aurantiacibacter zhengii]RIV83041.1 hypothetical protein D2V07_17110 [Aurantiacibacter zhengii]